MDRDLVPTIARFLLLAGLLVGAAGLVAYLYHGWIARRAAGKRYRGAPPPSGEVALPSDDGPTPPAG